MTGALTCESPHITHLLLVGYLGPSAGVCNVKMLSTDVSYLTMMHIENVQIRNPPNQPNRPCKSCVYLNIWVL